MIFIPQSSSLYIYNELWLIEDTDFHGPAEFLIS